MYGWYLLWFSRGKGYQGSDGVAVGELLPVDATVIGVALWGGGDVCAVAVVPDIALFIEVVECDDSKDNCEGDDPPPSHCWHLGVSVVKKEWAVKEGARGQSCQR